MNQQNVQTLQALNAQMESIDLEAEVKKFYPSHSELDSIQLTQITLPEFISLYRRVTSQFSISLKDREVTMVLPFIYRHAQFGNSQVDTQMQALISNLLQPDFNTAENNLLWLVGYQLENGIYNKTAKRISETLSASLLTLSEKMNLQNLNLENNHKQIESLFKTLDDASKEIQNLINQKRDELTQIATNLTTSNTQVTQIAEQLNKGTEQSSRLNTLVEQQEQNRLAADKKIKELQDIYTKTSSDLEEHIKETTGLITEFKKQVSENTSHLEFVEGKRKFFEERIEYLENLIGREVGASLFETFKQRKIELHKPVIFWRWAVPSMALLTIGWVFFLFARQLDITNINLWWQVFAVNTLKSIPAVFLLLFSINQYRKERNFQEEYAFKSAVALTIDAYCNRISNMDNKDKLLMESVLGIYSTPIEEKQRGKLKSKNLMNTLQTMADTTKELLKNKN